MKTRVANAIVDRARRARLRNYNYSMKRLKLLRLLCFFVSRGVAFSAGQSPIVAFIRVLMSPDFCLRARKTRTLALWLNGFWALLLLLAIYASHLFWMSIESSVHINTD